MVMFIFTIVLMVSLSVVLYLVAQALPRVAEDAGTDGTTSRGWWSRSNVPERIDAALDGFLLKFLRKVKVTVLRIDNAVSTHMEKVKPENNGKKQTIDFKEIAGQNKEGKNGNI